MCGATLVDVLNGTDTYREWATPEPGFVCRWSQDVHVDFEHRVVPDGCADIIVGDGGAVVVGLADVPFVHALSAGSSCLGLRVRPEAVASVFGLPADELRNASVALDDVVGSRRARLLVDAVESGSPVVVEPEPAITGALSLLRSHSVDDVASAMGLSARHLRRLLLRATGVGPKTYQRVMRFQAFVSASDGGTPLAIAAAEAGYADQAHLTREVGRLAGVTPAALVASRSSRAAFRSTPQR